MRRARPMIGRCAPCSPSLSRAALALGGCATSAVTSRATYANPVLDADFPDPTVIRAPDGFYYGYATQTERDGRMDQHPGRAVGRPRPLATISATRFRPSPAGPSTTQDFWAPTCVRDGARYIMYYSAKPDSSDERHGLCLGDRHGELAGRAVRRHRPSAPVRRELRQHRPDGVRRSGDRQAAALLGIGVRADEGAGARRPTGCRSRRGSQRRRSSSGRTRSKDAFPVLVEGSWVTRHGGYYYLFYSGDNCCGPKANYAVMVARSKSATGPFETLEQATGKPHSIILAEARALVRAGAQFDRHRRGRAATGSSITRSTSRRPREQAERRHQHAADHADRPDRLEQRLAGDRRPLVGAAPRACHEALNFRSDNGRARRRW